MSNYWQYKKGAGQKSHFAKKISQPTPAKMTRNKTVQDIYIYVSDCSV